MSFLIRRISILIGFMLFALLTGCGSDQAKTAIVKGTITFKGKPVPNGTVTFIPLGEGPAATGELQKDGSYTLKTYKDADGAVLGKHKVIVVAMEDMAGRLPEDRTPTPPPIVPHKYTSAATTDLQAEVKEGENIVDFDLKGDKGR